MPRIAVAGAHGTGKSTLVAELIERLPGHHAVDEPYHAMLDDGVAFAARPSAEDYEDQLARSVESILADADAAVVFDRSPADFLAYLAAVDARPDAPVIASARSALATLDVVVYVPIEMPDRIEPTAFEMRGLRRRVDAVLRDMLLDDGWGLGVVVIVATGTTVERADRVLGQLALR